jgi:filamentous hemagglutinin family protein
VKKIIHIATAIAFFFLSIFPVQGFTFNVNVFQGNATVSSNGNTFTITATGRAILQGNTSIPVGTTVKVMQGINDILLRDTTGNATNILGSLLSNGNIILINTMGVFIGRSAKVNVGGLIASTLDIKNQLFMNGTYQFEQIPGLNPAQILNEANINVAKGGYVILLSDRVVNKGTITAYMGTVALGSGEQATVSFDQGGLVNLVIDKGLAKQLTDSSGKPQAQVVNSSAIHASGGKVQIT